MNKEIRIITNGNKYNKKRAKILEEMINKDWEKYKGIISAISIARTSIEIMFGYKTPDNCWGKIMEEAVKLTYFK